MRKVILFILMCTLFCVNASASADISVFINDELVALSSDPVNLNGRVLVPIREIAECMDCVVSWYDDIKTTEIYNKILTVSLTLNSNVISVYNELTGDTQNVEMDTLPTLFEGRTYLPLRYVIEILGGTIRWDDESNAIYISYTSTGNREVAGAVSSDNTFYFQNEEKWNFPNYGSGYCWVCSYAMVITDITGKEVTPNDVAAVNEEACGNGAYCYHWQILDKFDVRFTPALPEYSPWYGGYNVNNGGTLIKNPDMDDDVVRAALKEALEMHPNGVMVRYEGYPHTMVAVKYADGKVYFNDPVRTDYEYKEYSNKECVTFENTCLRNYKLSDITFIQALKVQ